MMTQSNIDYTHNEPESLVSKISKIVMSIIRVKWRIEKSMTTGKIDQEPASIPKSITSNFQVDISELNGRKIWRLQPEQNTSDKVVLYLHGGAYIYSLERVHWQVVEQLLIRTGATFVVPAYPLAPRAQWQDVYYFVEALYEQLLAQTSAGNVTFLGDSAGAGLALGFVQWLRNEKKALPRQLILLAPWLDMTMSTPGIEALESKEKLLTIKGLKLAGEAYAGELDHKDYRLSPIYGDLEGLPPISLFIGTHDIFLPDSRKLKGMMRAAKRPFNYFEYPNMMHDWMIVVNMKEAKHALEQVARLIVGDT